MSFEIQSAYLEGRADIAQQMMALAERAKGHQYTKGMVILEIQGICAAPMQYDTEGVTA